MRGELPKSDRTLAAYPNSIYPVSLSPKPLFSLKPLCFCGYVDLSPLLAQQHFFVLLQDLALFFFWLFFWHSSSGLWQSPLLFPSSLLPNSTLKNSLWSWSPGELVKMQIWIQLVLCGSQDSAFLTSSQLIRCWTQWSWTLIWVARFYSVRHRQYLFSLATGPPGKSQGLFPFQEQIEHYKILLYMWYIKPNNEPYEKELFPKKDVQNQNLPKFREMTILFKHSTGKSIL